MNVRLTSIIAVATALLGAGCSKSEEQAEPTPAVEHLEHTATEAAEAPPVVKVPEGAKVFFVSPKDGEEVKGPLVDGKVSVKITMGVEGIQVKAAGEQVEGTGHHHLIVDGQHIALGSVVPKDDTHIHFGDGQTEAELMLAPGEHEITMQFADGAHLSYGDKLASTIKIKVTGDGTLAEAKPE